MSSEAFTEFQVVEMFDAQQNKFIVNPTIGEVNYSKGTLIVRNLTITSMADIKFEFILKPWRMYQDRQRLKKRIEELRKRDPFIYK